MDNYNGLTVKIDSKNESIHNCLACGKELSRHEYNMVFNRCSTCNRKYHNKNRAKRFVDVNEINDVDEILNYKLNYKRS